MDIRYKMLLKIPRSIFYRKILNHTFFAANGMIFDLWFPFLESSSFKYTRLPDQVDTLELLSHTHSTPLLKLLELEASHRLRREQQKCCNKEESSS